MIDGVAQLGKRPIGPLGQLVVLDDPQIRLDRVELGTVSGQIVQHDALGAQCAALGAHHAVAMERRVILGDHPQCRHMRQRLVEKEDQILGWQLCLR